MKKRRLKKNLNFLKKEKRSICYEMELSYEEIKQQLRSSYKIEKAFRETVKRTKLKKKFKKQLAKNLGVKYSIIKDHFPLDLNSTTIAHFLKASLYNKSYEDIRNASQNLKLEFEEIYKVMI